MSVCSVKDNKSVMNSFLGTCPSYLHTQKPPMCQYCLKKKS